MFEGLLRSIKSLTRRRARRAHGELRGRIRLTKELCPYCFDYFNMSETPFRCMVPVCVKQPDEISKKKWNDSRPKGKVIEADGFARQRECPECHTTTKTRLCPNCHQDLPHTIGEFRNLVISVVGAKNVGKSHYLPVLIETLRRSIGPDLHFLIQPLNDDTANRYNNDYRNRLISQKKLLAVTDPGLSNINTRMPLVFRLSFYNEYSGGRRETTNLVTLAFFDTAGEDMKSQDTLAYVNKYIFRSDGIILLLDPLQLDFVRDQLSASNTINLPNKDIETTDIITRMDNLIHGGRNLSADVQIGIPLALTVSKLDAVESLLDRQLGVLQNSNHVSGFNVTDFENVNAEVQSLIDYWGGQYLIEQVKSGFRCHAFFAMSALGTVPSGQDVSSLRPKRVADPFLWILYQHKLIRAKKEQNA